MHFGGLGLSMKLTLVTRAGSFFSFLSFCSRWGGGGGGLGEGVAGQGSCGAQV